MIGVGVDFGTSNSTAAWFDGRELHFVRLQADGPIMPTALHLSREFVGITGSAAINQYVQENAARLVQLVPEIIGYSGTHLGYVNNDVEAGELESERNVVFGPPIDPGLPGRLFLGLKRLLGNAELERVPVFRRPYRLVALLTPVLVTLREALQGALGSAPVSVHVGRPVVFEGRGAGHNALALARLQEAAEHAGFRDVAFYPEPVAATLSYLHLKPSAARCLLTVDFGGGTLDLCVLRRAGSEFEVLATAGAALGGDRIDQMIYRRLVFPELGAGENWSRVADGRLVETAFPFNEYEEALLNWPITHTLNQNQYKTRLTALIERGGAAAAKFQRLKDLINYNYSYIVFRAIKHAKAQLSSVEHAVIDVPELNLQVSISRLELNDILSGVLDELQEMVRSVLERSELSAADIDVVIRTGGSSQIVAVRDLLDSLFPGKVTEHDPFTSVAGGLAIANYHRHRHAAAD